MGARTLRGLFGFLLLAPLLAAACGRSEETRVAERILERYRSSAGAKPLAAAQLIKLKLTGPGGARGTAEIAWQGSAYRERRESAGLTTVRGLQGGKAFYTDEDGVTRVASEPVVRELITRHYFWRRAFLFQDHDKQRPGLGPADEASASVRFGLHGGNTLQLNFSRRDGQLVGVRSPGFRFDYDSPTHFQDTSDPDAPVQTEIAWVGLPTGPLEDTSAGGGRARFRGPFADLPVEITGGAPVVPATIGGARVRLRLDASASGPVRVSAELARRIGLPFLPDAFGREVAGPTELAFDGLLFPSVHLEKARDDLEGADAAAGGTLFRETVVECDPAAGRLRLHDTSVWAPPAGYQRFIIDDDGNRPVAPLRRGAKEFRVVPRVDPDWQGAPGSRLGRRRHAQLAALARLPDVHRHAAPMDLPRLGRSAAPYERRGLAIAHSADRTAPASRRCTGQAAILSAEKSRSHRIVNAIASVHKRGYLVPSTHSRPWSGIAAPQTPQATAGSA